MSQPELDLIERVYRAFDTHDLAAIATLFSPEVQIRQTTELPWGGHFRGHAGAAEFFTTLLKHIDSKVIRERLFVAGDRVVQTGRTVGTTAAGVTFDVPEVHVWRVHDGRITAYDAYIDTPAMLAALGGRP
ncbi:nuclear transport factor 2 family protein [Nocardia huaxiensis]|uniref:nuclear transport factor 2 family protein n=1 Tax=Nocardia huaxiensis TaxID=2755382 RepID=UPI001E4D52AA|nr:nuclear transport factor 2 family protein [Nocardia huaxiensis]UFS99492.1 nuclear transport factor 2 family protein [Nocardia huaxiensis]